MANKINSGFTLIELIVSIAILSVLSAILVPQYVHYVEKSRKTVCKSNISELNHSYDIMRVQSNVSEDKLSFEDIFELVVADISSGLMPESGKLTGACPSKGQYTYSFVSDGALTVDCNKHPADSNTGADGGNGSDTNKIPNTDISFETGIWPTESHFPLGWESVYIEPTVFQHTDGKFYVVSKRFGVTKGQAMGGPESIKSWSQITQLSGTILSPSNISSSNSITVQNGDVFCDSNGSYYVYTSYNGINVSPPGTAGSKNWYKIPQ